MFHQGKRAAPFHEHSFPVVPSNLETMTQLIVLLALKSCSLGGTPRCSSNSGNHVLQISLMNQGSDRNSTLAAVTPIWRVKLAMYSDPASEVISPIPTTYRLSHSVIGFPFFATILPSMPTWTMFPLNPPITSCRGLAPARTVSVPIQFHCSSGRRSSSTRFARAFSLASEKPGVTEATSRRLRRGC